MSVDSHLAAATPGTTEAPIVVYDGECPFCSTYVRLMRLREAFGAVRLVDARSSDPILDEIKAARLNLDDGMVLKLDGALYHGDRALHMLALMSTRSGIFNRLTRAVFSSPRLTRRLYPGLVAGRNATLALLGRRKIGAGRPA